MVSIAGRRSVPHTASASDASIHPIIPADSHKMAKRTKKVGTYSDSARRACVKGIVSRARAEPSRSASSPHDFDDESRRRSLAGENRLRRPSAGGAV